MPLYEYVCGDCRKGFEMLVRRFGDAVDCPGCGSGRVEKQLSTFAVATSSSAASMDAAAGCGASACGQGACGSGACALPN